MVYIRSILLGLLLALTSGLGCTGCSFDGNATAEECTEIGSGKTFLSGITFLTGTDLHPFQTRFCRPELADPYATVLKDGVVVSGTAGYFLRFASIGDLSKGGPYGVTRLEGDVFFGQSWDLKPVPWSAMSWNGTQAPSLWNPAVDTEAPRIVWYGGHMRPGTDGRGPSWPEDNYSRDVFAFTQGDDGRWYSREGSIFSLHSSWPRSRGNFLGHRYGQQIVMVPKKQQGGTAQVPMVFYEEVTNVRTDGSPAVTQIFGDEMSTPFQASGNPVMLVSPYNPNTGKPYPSAVREDGSVLVEGPLYFRFNFEGEPWEAIGFSAGSYYGNYSASFASRKVADGLQGKPFLIDLTDDGSDLHDAGAELRMALNLAGTGRPAVIVSPDGNMIPDPRGSLQLLLHGYRRDILPDNDYAGLPTKYRLDQMFRVAIHARLDVKRGRSGALRFWIPVE